jgi:hypothetical protein
VVGPLNLSDEDIKEVEAEDEEATGAMLVTVEEDNGTLIKRSQITDNKMISPIVTNNIASRADIRRNNHDSGFDLSLHNHMSIRDLSPNLSNGDIEGIAPSRTTSNLSLSPSRIISNRLASSEISDT